MAYEMNGTADNSDGSKTRSQATTEPQVSMCSKVWSEHGRLVAGEEHGGFVAPQQFTNFFPWRTTT